MIIGKALAILEDCVQANKVLNDKRDNAVLFFDFLTQAKLRLL